MSDNVDKPDDQSSASSPETPEVEAEIVTDEDLVVDAVVDSGGAFDDTDDDAVPPVRKSTLTLGVVFFILFAVAAVVVFAVWRFQSGPATLDVAEGTIAESTIETPQSALDGTSASAQLIEPLTTTPTIDATIIAQASDEDLVDRQPVQADPSLDLQLPDDRTESVIPDVMTPENDALPNDSAEVVETNSPETMSVDNVDTTEPEAAFDLSASDLVVDGVTGDDAISVADRIADNVDIAEAEPESLDSIVDDQVDAVEQDVASLALPENTEADAFLNDEPSADDSASNDALASETLPAVRKVDNDEVQEIKESFDAEIARLEAALAAEREQNATQRDQLEDMRRNFQAALAARDRSANQQITALNARLDKIENGNEVQGGRRAAAALALNNLRHVAEQGEPFANELDVLAGYIPQGGEIATLRRYADVEIPMVGELEAAFSVAAREALAAAGRQEKTGFTEKLSARVTSLVSVRPAGPIEGDSARAIISRAEAFIEAGDISAGANELGALVDGPRTAMADWLALAQSRIAVDGAIASLGARLAAPVR